MYAVTLSLKHHGKHYLVHLISLTLNPACFKNNFSLLTISANLSADQSTCKKPKPHVCKYSNSCNAKHFGEARAISLVVNHINAQQGTVRTVVHKVSWLLSKQMHIEAIVRTGDIHKERHSADIDNVEIVAWGPRKWYHCHEL